MTKMLYASVIKLRAKHPVQFIQLGGQHAHAAFLDLVRKIDPSLAEQLHSAHTRKPFTLSPLQGLPKTSLLNLPGREIRGWALPEGWDCWLRLTILDDRIFRMVIEHFLMGSVRPEIRLGDGHFLVSEILTSPGSHSWADYQSVEEIRLRLEEPCPERIVFDLHTPTSFKLQNAQVETLPIPKLVFGNLAAAWRGLTGEDCVELVERYAQEHFLLTDYNLRQAYHQLHNRPQVGAVGKVEYLHRGAADHPVARAIHLLADLAFFSGLGRKTTMGMGQVRRLDNRYD